MRPLFPRLRRLVFERLEARLALATMTVDLMTDEFDNNFSPGDVSLREALFVTNNSSGPNTIKFAAVLNGKTISLNNELVIKEDVKIQGLGPDRLTIDAVGSHRLFSVLEGFRNVPNVEFVGLKLSGAGTADAGGALRTVGSNVIVRNCWITGNASTNHGGAIWVVGGTQNPGQAGALTVLDSTISENSAAKNGGGISISSGRLNLINSTVSGNSAEDQGGGLFASGGTVSIINSTLALNRADSDGQNDPGTDLGGGIARAGGTITLRNSIVMGNRRGTGTVANDIQGSVVLASARNIIGDAASAGGLADGVNANIVGNHGAGTLAVAAVMEAALTLSAGKTRSHNLVATSPAIDSGANSLAVDANGAALAKDQRGISRIIDGDRNGTALVDRGAVEFGRAPIVNLSGAINYDEQATAKILAPTATVTDLDSANFASGDLTVSIVGATSADRLSIRNQGDLAGQIGVSGSQIRFGGDLIGTFVGGGGISPLRVFLNANATPSATQALARNITFHNLSDFPPTNARHAAFVLTDNTGLKSVTKNVPVTIIPQNDAPSIGNLGSDLVTYNLVGNNPTKILPLGTVIDPDSLNFAGGSLSVQIIQAAGADNRLSFATPFSRVGDTLQYSGTPIGTVNANGGVGTTQLVVNFIAAATRTIVEQLVRSITFQIASPTGDDEPTRTIQVSLTDGDGDGGTSNTRTLTVDPKFVRG